MDSMLRTSSEVADSYENDYSIEFHGSVYVLSIFASDSLLRLEIELVDTCDRWSGEFSAQYIEEISHKAGNFKKFSVFVKMLNSAFSRESESVYVDLLTYNDLEMLKARKMGNGSSVNPGNTASSLSRSHMKRYIILTYSGEFDRVHFPLPLVYEEIPNTQALQRTIKRLRQQAHQRELLMTVPSSSKEREIRHIDSQLRQENTELRHRLRQLESRNGQPGPDQTSTVIAKLKRQVDHLKKELSDMTLAYERLRTDTAREKAKWRSQGAPDTKRESSNTKLSKLQSALESERVDHRRERQRLLRELDDMKRLLARRNQTRIPSDDTRMLAKGLTSRGNSSHRTTPRAAGSRSRSPRQSHLDVDRHGRHRGSSVLQRRQHTVPPTAKSRERAGSASRSRSPSSSLGGRFDPTAYALERAERMKKSRSSPTWGASSTSRYTQESGYSSATSQSSNDSRRSRKSSYSASSRGSSRASSAASEHSDSKLRNSKSSGKRRPKRKGKSKKLVSSGVGAGVRRTEDVSRSSGALVGWQHTSSRDVGSHANAPMQFQDRHGGWIDASHRETLGSTISKTVVEDVHPEDVFDFEDFKPTAVVVAPPVNRRPVDEIESNDSEGDAPDDIDDGWDSSRLRDSISALQYSAGADASDRDNQLRRARPSPHFEKENIHVGDDHNAANEGETAPKYPTASESNDTSDIDKRINALQKFLDKARSGILSDVDGNAVK